VEPPDSSVDPRKALSELERLNRLYAMLSHINRTIVRTEDPQDLYATACRIAIEYGGYALAWVSLLEPGSDRVVPVASAGVMTTAQMEDIADAFAGQGGPTVDAKRAGSPVIVNDTGATPSSGPWQAMRELWGIRSGASFPIRLEGDIIGAFNVAGNEPNGFRDREINLLVEVADDLSFALDGIRRTEKHMAAETKMRYLAYYDSRTGLPTRVLFEERLAEACRNAAGKTVAVLVANLRRYHGIVQLLGPGAGLDIIRAMAARLEAALPALPVARISESKFALMVSEPTGLDVVEELAWSIQRELASPTRADGQELFLDPFVGIAVFPQDGEQGEILKHATQAAGVPSDYSGSSCRFFNSDLDDGSRKRLDLDTALRRALERNEFRLHYQPQIDLASGRVIGTEALLRWQRPDYGLVSPLEFVPLLEDNGLIGAVGEWALHEACRRTKQWQDEGLPSFRVAVNLSARQFHDGDIRAIVRRALDATGLDPRWLELELTEGIVLLNAEGVIRTMHDLNADGVSHALDDFGTGYSSLSYLQRLPVARIKIDRSFVTHITSSPSDAAIARAVVGMAHSLGLSVIAEGVETEGQLGFLRGIGCEEIQGYFFSRPLPEDEFTALLREGRCMPPMNAGKPERVLLLVDDEASVISSLSRLLRRQGYRIVSTTSAREGFDLLAMHRPGVVICDQRMPEMTGTEFLRRVKELHPDTVRIVLSGYTELSSVIDAVNHGAVFKFLTKPWEDDGLIECIKDAFRIYELGGENRELSSRLLAGQAGGSPPG
jgi:EAL domain-containing protein (putative c-di-GMP-specific phosphodiesterase class I)/GGDEF domain-containing protein/ActR/RegA family two-component response regulator